MNDPKEIAINVIKKWKAHRTPPRDGTAFTAIHAEDWMDLSVEFTAALQAEREDGCRRVNDAIGDRDPIIEKLKAEVEELKRVLRCRDSVIAACKDSTKFADEGWQQAAAELERVKAYLELERNTHRNGDRAFTKLLMDAVGLPYEENVKARVKLILDGIERVKSERDEAVKMLEPLSEFAKACEFKIQPDAEFLSVKIPLQHCRAARAVVEKVKQHHSLDIRNPLPYNTPDEQPQAGEAEHEAET